MWWWERRCDGLMLPLQSGLHACAMRERSRAPCLTLARLAGAASLSAARRNDELWIRQRRPAWSALHLTARLSSETADRQQQRRLRKEGDSSPLCKGKTLMLVRHVDAQPAQASFALLAMRSHMLLVDIRQRLIKVLALTLCVLSGCSAAGPDASAAWGCLSRRGRTNARGPALDWRHCPSLAAQTPATLCRSVPRLGPVPLRPTARRVGCAPRLSHGQGEEKEEA
jgi:hypothetical protein